MALQIWSAEEIENVVWGTQTVVSAILITSQKKDQPDYQQGFTEGFLVVTQQVILAFEQRFRAERPAFQHDIVDTLFMIQGVIPQKTGRVGEQSLVFCSGFNHGSETALMGLATFFGVTLFSPINLSSLPSGSSLPGLWFREDKDHLLMAFQSVTLTTINAAKSPVYLSDYQTGFEDALRTIAKSLGIRLLSPGSTPRNSRMAWLRVDIELNLAMINRTRKSSRIPTVNEDSSTDYKLGFDMTLTGIAQAFGISLK